MKRTWRILRSSGPALIVLGVTWACGFDDTLREYLDAHFWLPFAKRPRHFEQANVQRISQPFAGMDASQGDSPLVKLRTEYRQIAQPSPLTFDAKALLQALASARADKSLTAQQREEVDLIDAKIDMRLGQPAEPQLLLSAKTKIESFLRTAQTAEYLSEARGWLAHIYYVLGDQTAAGKIYLDELNRNGSNLSQETLLNSLQMNYGYDGGAQLRAHLEEYFDTPEHAAFAIQMLTNPHWDRYAGQNEARKPRTNDNAQAYAHAKQLLETHTGLLKTTNGTNALALLGMRTALSVGDPAGAIKIAAAVPIRAPIRSEPDFQWMLASAHFLSHDFAGAESPLLRLFRSTRSSEDQRAAAAYALCGVYQKRKNVEEQLRYALWLHAKVRKNDMYMASPSVIDDLSVYWAVSGWDLNLLLEDEAPTEAIESFAKQNTNLTDIRLVQYSLAVRLTRQNRYEEAAELYQSIHALRRAPRIRRLAALYREANRKDLSGQQKQEAEYSLAEFISKNENGIYYNDSLWGGLQRYALTASKENRVTRREREALIARERKLKDDQEEYWRAYLILRDIAREAGKSPMGRKAATLAVHCLNSLSERFERQAEIQKAGIELSAWLRR
jgi:hypothetical protein